MMELLDFLSRDLYVICRAREARNWRSRFKDLARQNISMASLTLFLNMSSSLSRIKEDVISKVCVVYRLQITVVTIMNYILRSEPNDA